jgi:hypothetical protein
VASAAAMSGKLWSVDGLVNFKFSADELELSLRSQLSPRPDFFKVKWSGSSEPSWETVVALGGYGDHMVFQYMVQNADTIRQQQQTIMQSQQQQKEEQQQRQQQQEEDQVAVAAAASSASAAVRPRREKNTSVAAAQPKAVKKAGRSLKRRRQPDESDDLPTAAAASADVAPGRSLSRQVTERISLSRQVTERIAPASPFCSIAHRPVVASASLRRTRLDLPQKNVSAPGALTQHSAPIAPLNRARLASSIY